MFTLDKRNYGNPNKRAMFRYLVAAIFTLIFGIIYEIFSHNVFSIFMVGAFVIPLAFGSVPALIIYKKGTFVPFATRHLYGSGIAVLTLGSITKGVIDIYGTTNSKLILFPIVGLSMIIMALYRSIN